MLVDRRPGFEDAIAREQVREEVERSVSVHAGLTKQVQEWGAAMREYLSTRESVDSVDAAGLQLSLLDAHEQEKRDLANGGVATLKALGEQIRTTEYKSDLSQWAYPKPAEVTALETAVDALWVEIEGMAAEKRRILDDHLARELYAQETRLLAGQHEDKANQLSVRPSALLPGRPSLRSRPGDHLSGPAGAAISAFLFGRPSLCSCRGAHPVCDRPNVCSLGPRRKRPT